MKNILKTFTVTEIVIWISSVIVVSLSYVISGAGDILTIFASLIGVTGLIFVAKGYVFGQVLCIFFALIYGIISLSYRYYGETITYLCMSLPVALAAVISWFKHPYKESAEVEVSDLTPKKVTLLSVLTLAVTTAFYFILSALGTENLVISTVSVATSFAASSLTVLRSPYYAVVYGINDIVLIVLWILASIEQISYLPMVLCFIMFLFNDMYGFYNWLRIRKRQKAIQA